VANKNYSGARYTRAQDKEDRLIDKIDKRAASGDNRENTDTVYNSYTNMPNGERVWSF
jgi:hypothetical protein